MRKLFLTFDTEDFISNNSILSLRRILECLKKHDLTALFFITGHMAEKLYNFPDVVDLLNEHQIGYHSSSHTVHPTVFEYTDVENYKEAYQSSLRRETAHINPLTGEVEGRGGIYALKDLFPKKQVVAFRAPGYCWSPPHLEALKILGIDYDFSADVASKPINYKEIIFYPFPIIHQWTGTLAEYRLLFLSLMKNTTCVLNTHPSLMVNRLDWDSIYWKTNPTKISPPPARSFAEKEKQFHSLDLLLRRIRDFQKIHSIEVTPALKKPRETLSCTRIDVEKCYQKAIYWARFQRYEPKFLHRHFLTFFDLS